MGDVNKSANFSNEIYIIRRISDGNILQESRQNNNQRKSLCETPQLVVKYIDVSPPPPNKTWPWAQWDELCNEQSSGRNKPKKKRRNKTKKLWKFLFVTKYLRVVCVFRYVIEAAAEAVAADNRNRIQGYFRKTYGLHLRLLPENDRISRHHFSPINKNDFHGQKSLCILKHC